MTPPRTRFIVNPKAGAGRAGRNLAELQQAVKTRFPYADVTLTRSSGHGRHLAATAAAEGIERLAVVGGDGTIHEVVNGLMDHTETAPLALSLAIIPAGTGSDLRRTLGIPDGIHDALDVLDAGITREVDVGQVKLQTATGPTTEHFINVAGCGANGEVVRKANSMSKRLGGRVTFFRAAVETSLTYNPAEVALKWTDEAQNEQTWQGRAASIFIANGRYCGGGMNVGHKGRIDDGLFDVTILPPDNAATQIVRSRLLYNGTLHTWPGVQTIQVRHLEVRPISSAPVQVDLDGENPGVLPAIFRVVPTALKVHCTAEC